MIIKLKNSGSAKDMEKHYQKLRSEGYGAMLSKRTKTTKGFTPSWDTEEIIYEIEIGSEMNSEFLFDLSMVLGEELVVYREQGQPVIEIYDDWRE